MLNGMEEKSETSVGRPEFMRLKHFREKPTGVYEILCRYL